MTDNRYTLLCRLRSRKSIIEKQKKHIRTLQIFCICIVFAIPVSGVLSVILFSAFKTSTLESVKLKVVTESILQTEFTDIANCKPER